MIMALDFGTKRIGLAKWNSRVDVVLPAGQIEVENPVQRVAKVSQKLKDEKTDLVVVGLPIGLKNEENENTARIKKFAEDLKERGGFQIKFADEKFSSRQADRMSGGVSRDEKAAMIILQDYLKHGQPC